MKKIFPIIILLFSINALCADEFNTYRWNRKNVQNGNGVIDKSPWFEWWYYKVVLPETNDAYFFVYGVVNPWDKDKTMEGTRAYVGMGDFTKQVIAEKLLPIKDFRASYETTKILVGDSYATDKKIVGNIYDNESGLYAWDINVQKDWTFNATSWATGRMITNIEWYPAQAGAWCSGKILAGRVVKKFTNAPCYQDRNWGHSFPKWWTWIVSNKFSENPDTVLAIGGGQPKVFGVDGVIQGVAIGLKHKGREYTFRPNEFDYVKVDINFGKWEVEAENLKYRVEISAFAPESRFMDLQFMTPTGEIFHDYEALIGSVKLKLYKKKGRFFRDWDLVDTLYSDFAGIEYGSREQNGLDSIMNSRQTIFETNRHRR